MCAPEQSTPSRSALAGELTCAGNLSTPLVMLWNSSSLCVLVNIFLPTAAEVGRLSEEHLVQEDAQEVPVDGLAVSGAL
jgi:hypothetical protein